MSEIPATDEEIEKWEKRAKLRIDGPFPIRDGQMLALIARIRAEIDILTKSGIIEVAVRNPSVMEYMKHWEGRALKAEAALTAAPAVELDDDGMCDCGDFIVEKCDCVGHTSDCAINNRPAYPADECDCKNVTEPQAIAEPELGDAADAKPCIAAALRAGLQQIIDRSNNGELGTSKVIDMRNIAITLLARAISGDTSNG